MQLSHRVLLHLQVVDCGEDGPPRCKRCKAYVNPFTVFTDDGRKFQCNLCSHSNETPVAYMCALGLDGCRGDKHERPELCHGSVEFVATKEYMVRAATLRRCGLWTTKCFRVFALSGRKVLKPKMSQKL